MKHLLVMLLLLCSVSVSAQDVIVKKDGSTIVCRVVEVTTTEITYKKWSDLNGSNYVMDKSLASAINYESGKKVSLSEATNLYKPNNQNDGVQQYNDRALWVMDDTQNKIVKKYRLWGWICGITGIGAGAFTTFFSFSCSSADRLTLIPIGGAVAVGGLIASTYCFVTAQKRQKQVENLLQSTSLFRQEFIFNNGSSLSAGIDMLSDRTIGSNTFGLGLRYNF